MNRTYEHKGIRHLIQDPNICPHCHITNIPHLEWQSFSSDTDGHLVHISAWHCSNSRCNKIFVALFRQQKGIVEFKRYLNGLPKGPDWPKPIEDLTTGVQTQGSEPKKSLFIKTYLQSLEAENSGLDEIAGMGYRKAIEYLVKDWAIQSRPTDKDIIEKLWLGQVINNYYSGDLKEILERATWLGNDQSHYNKLFEEYDINTLKELIDLIMVELDRQYKRDHYIQTIEKRK